MADKRRMKKSDVRSAAERPRETRDRAPDPAFTFSTAPSFPDATVRIEQRLASALIHLGAFIGDIGVLFQEQPGLPLPRQDRLSAAKAALRSDLEFLREIIQSDPNIPDQEKRDMRDKISEAIGSLRACNIEVATGILNEGFFIAKGLPPPGGPPVNPNKGWFFEFDVALSWSMLALWKNRWDAAPPGRPKKVVVGPNGDSIQIQVGTVTVSIKPGYPDDPTIPVDKMDDAEALARRLDQMFAACNYPDKDFVKELFGLFNRP